jgi:hypothetical protein
MPHIHGGIAHGVNVFLLVITIGVFWRLASSILAAQDGMLATIGKGMAFFY